MKSRYRAARRALIFWTLFIGIGTAAGAVYMLADPSGKLSGMDAMLPYFHNLPFADLLYRNFVFPGAVLLLNGLLNLAAAGLLGVWLGGILGLAGMIGACILFYIFPVNFLSVIYFTFGAIQAVTGYMAQTFFAQEQFCVRESDYLDIGKNPERLVVYFSRMGYTKKLALQEANRTGACIFEIKATEKTEGTTGFWWCGRYGMHRWDMPIEETPADLEHYGHVTICTPIWVFALSAPVRSFCRNAAGKIKEVDYILVHHQKNTYQNAAREMDRILGFKNSPFVSICCRKGMYLTSSERKIPSKL